MVSNANANQCCLIQKNWSTTLGTREKKVDPRAATGYTWQLITAEHEVQTYDTK